MCDAGTQEAVTTVVKELIKQRVSFTGYDVYTRMHNKLIRRGVDYTNNQEPPKSISTFVRQLFNSGDPAFTGYGSTIIPGINGRMGPVMYFALPFSAKIRAKAIEADMNKIVDL